jgi:hypothetical protein
MLRALCSAALVLASAPVAAQEIERFAFDTVLSTDLFVGENVSTRPQIIVDVAGAMRLSDNVQAYFRPWFRLPRPNTPSGPHPTGARNCGRPASATSARPARTALRRAWMWATTSHPSGSE